MTLGVDVVAVHPDSFLRRVRDAARLAERAARRPKLAEVGQGGERDDFAERAGRVGTGEPMHTVDPAPQLHLVRRARKPGARTEPLSHEGG